MLYRARAARVDAADPRSQPRSDRVHVSGRDRGARRASPEGALVRSRAIRRSPISPACASGRIPGSTCTSSPIPSRSRRSSRSPGRAASGGPSRRPRPRSWPLARCRTPGARCALPADGKVIAVSGGGWGVGDLVGATRAALAVPGATVLCLCGRNDKLRARGVQRFAGEPRLRVMGFTDRMGDVLAASDALVHSSAGLTVLEAIIRGCPVISYGFGYGHVRASNAALERFGLAQVARSGAGDRSGARASALARTPRARRALRPPSLDGVADPRRRAARPPGAGVAAAHRAGDRGRRRGAGDRRLGAHHRDLLQPGVAFRAHAPTTTVRDRQARDRRARRRSSEQLPALASAFAGYGLHVSFAFDQPPAATELTVRQYGDQPVPRASPRRPGAVAGDAATSSTTCFTRWASAATSSTRRAGPASGQWWLAHRAGGRLIAGAVHVDDDDDPLGQLRAGEVIELSAAQHPTSRAATAQAAAATSPSRPARGYGRPADARSPTRGLHGAAGDVRRQASLSPVHAARGADERVLLGGLAVGGFSRAAPPLSGNSL